VLIKVLLYNDVIALVPLCSVSTKVPELMSVCSTELRLFWLVVAAKIYLFFIVKSF